MVIAIRKIISACGSVHNSRDSGMSVIVFFFYPYKSFRLLADGFFFHRL